MRLFHCGLACSVVMIFLGFGAFAYDNQDLPVSSNDQGGPRPHIREGVVGRVTAFDGHPVAGALIGARSLDDPSLPIPEIAILSGSDGRYTWRLFPGTYEISVLAEGYRCPPKRVVVKSGQAVTADFKLERAP
jgi:hypothetical protein